MNYFTAIALLISIVLIGCSDVDVNKGSVIAPEPEHSIGHAKELLLTDGMKMITQDEMHVVYWPNRVMIFPIGKYTSVTTFVEPGSDGTSKEWIRFDDIPTNKISFGDDSLYYQTWTADAKPYTVTAPIDYGKFIELLENGVSVKMSIQKSTLNRIASDEISWTLPKLLNATQQCNP